MPGTTQSHVDNLVDQTDNDALIIDEGDPIYTYYEILATELDALDVTIKNIYDDLFVTSASGHGLDELGREVGVSRETSEGDSHLRKRIRTAEAAATTDTTFEQFAQFALNILETDAGNVEIDLDPAAHEEYAISVLTEVSVIEDSTFTASEIGDLLTDTVPANGRVSIDSYGSFEFADTIDDSYDPGSSAGFGSGTFAGPIQN